MSVRIYRGKGGIFHSSSCVGEVTYEKSSTDSYPLIIHIKSGSGFFGDEIATGKKSGGLYEITIHNKGLILKLKERRFTTSGSSIPSGNGYSSIGKCENGKIISQKNNIVGTYSCTTGDLSEKVITTLASIGAGLLLSSELNIDNNFC